MKTIVFSENKESYFAKRLKELAPAYFDIKIIQPSSCNVCTDKDKLSVFYKGEEYSNIKNIFWENDYSYELTSYIDLKSFVSINSLASLEKCNQFFSKTQQLSQIKGVKTLKTYVINKRVNTEAFEKKLPALINLPSFQNDYLPAIYVENSMLLNVLFDFYFFLKLFLNFPKNLILQQLTPNSSKQMFHFLILEDKIKLAFVKNKTNTKKIMPSPLLGENILNISRGFGLDFCFISGIKTNKGLAIVDISPFPDIEKIEKSYKIEIVPALISFISRKNSVS